MMAKDTVIEVEDLTKFFPITEGIIRQREVGRVHAVENVTFKVLQGETLGLVGESGCGKTTTARMLLRLLTPTKGKIWIKGMEISQIKKKDMPAFRKSIQMVFQDPYASGLLKIHGDTYIYGKELILLYP